MAKYHGKGSRVYVDGYDLSGYANSVELMGDADVVDTSTFLQSLQNSKSYVVGLTDDSATIGGFYDDDATKGAHDVLSARLGTSVAVMIPIISTGPGAPAYAGSAELVKNYNVQSGITQAVQFTTQLIALGTQGFDIGHMLMLKNQFTGTPAGSVSAYNNGTETTGGARLYLQNFGQHNAATAAAALGSVVIQHGTDSAFTTPVTLWAAGSQGTAPSASGTEVAGTVFQYVRVVSTSGSPHVAAMIKRL